MTRRRLPIVGVTGLTGVSAVLVAASVGLTFLPWVGIGESRRSSYRLLNDLDTLGVLSGPAAFTGQLLWVCQPALASLALLLAVLGRPKLSAVTASAVLLTTGAGSALVQQAPVQALVGARLALPVTLLGLLSLAVGLMGSRCHHRSGPDGHP